MTHIFGNYWLSDTGRIISKFMSKELPIKQLNGKYKIKVGSRYLMLSYDEVLKKIPRQITRTMDSGNEARQSLTKNATYNKLLNLFPDIRLPVTPDKDGIW